MQILHRTAWLAASFSFILSSAAWSAADIFAEVTLDVSTLKFSDKFAGCKTSPPIMPDLIYIVYYDDGTFVETEVVNGNPTFLDGTWTDIAYSSSQLQIRSDYTGNVGEHSGAWAYLLSSLELAAENSCGVPVTADGATLRVTQMDTTFKTTGYCSGTVTTSFGIDGYGTHSVTQLPVRMTRKVKAGGTFAYGLNYCY